jgi:hypothetical protein
MLESANFGITVRIERRGELGIIVGFFRPQAAGIVGRASGLRGRVFRGAKSNTQQEQKSRAEATLHYVRA